MSTTIAAIIATLITTGMTSAVSHDFTLVGGSLATGLFAASVVVRRNASVYPLFLLGTFAMVVLALVSSEANASAFPSTIHVLSMYFALIGLAFSSPDRSKFCQQLMMANNLLLTAWILYQGYDAEPLRAWQISNPSGMANIMPAQLNMTLPLVLVRINESTGQKRLAYIALICLNRVAVFLVMSRNGIATLLIILTLYLLFKHKRIAVLAIGGIVGLVHSFDSIAQIPTVRYLLVKLRFTGYHASTPRSMIWQVAWDHIKHDSILGVGPGGPKQGLSNAGVYHAHNNFIQVALETGIPSALIFALLFLLLLWLPVKTVFKSREHFVFSLPIVAYFSYSWTAMPLACPGVTLLFAACVHEYRVATQKEIQKQKTLVAQSFRQSATAHRITRAA